MKNISIDALNPAAEDQVVQDVFAQARLILRHKIHQARLPKRRLLRVEVEVPRICLPDWLAAQEEAPRYYWCDRKRNIEMAGIGEAHVVSPEGMSPISKAFMQIKEYLPGDNLHARYYGGFRFHFNSREDTQWQKFKRCRFVVPLIELYREGNVCRLACTLNNENSRQAAQDLLDNVHFRFDNEQASLPRFYDRTDLPAYSDWCALVREALADFEQTKLEKVVLARQTVLHAREPINPLAFIQRLSATAENVYLFCFQPGPVRAFLGASPERLFKRIGNRIDSEALAGTCPRGAGTDEDLAFENALLINEKDNREHQIVVKDVVETLSGFCSEIHADTAPHVLKLAHCQHLRTPITGILHRDISDNALLDALHPTPAVGGKPKAEALRWILDKEPFERGIYASPVGWVGSDKAEFCVGIRSGLISNRTLNLYTGAGIVPGSDPREEWLELNTKLAQFMDIISKDHENGNV